LTLKVEFKGVFVKNQEVAMKTSVWVGLTSLGMAASGILLPVLLGASNSERWRPVVAVDTETMDLDERPGRVGSSRPGERAPQVGIVPAPQPRATPSSPWLTRIANKVTQPLLRQAPFQGKRDRQDHRPRTW